MKAAVAPPGRVVRSRLLAAAPVLLSILVYTLTLHFGFVYDDRPQILENPAVQSTHFQTVFFTRHVWAQQEPQWQGNYYRPFFLLWMQGNYLIFGAHPLGWHATNLAVHALATLLVFWLARRLLADEVLASWAAAMFAVHPSHAEVVAWISGVDESLACLCCLAALLCWIRAGDKDSRRGLWTGGALASFSAAVLFKENAVALPLVLIAFDWLLGAGPREALRRSLPLWLVTCLYFAARLLALSGMAHAGATPRLLDLCLTLPWALWFYALHLVLPIGNSILYDLHLLSSPDPYRFVIPLLQVVAICGMAIVLARSSRKAAFLLAAMLFFLLPSLAGMLVFHNYELVHDRYLYTPSVFFAILVAMGVGALRGRRGERWVRAAAVLLIAAYGIADVYDALPWSDNVSLFGRAIAAAPHNPYAYSYLAEDLVRQGKPVLALPLYQKSVALDPHLWTTTIALGSTHLLLGQYRDAERAFLRAIEIYPDRAAPNGMQFYLLGMAQNREGEFLQAEPTLRKAIAIHPQYSQYHYELALALRGQGKTAEARQALEAELAIFPASQQARQLLAEIDSAPASDAKARR